jgi:hypothetical protein
VRFAVCPVVWHSEFIEHEIEAPERLRRGVKKVSEAEQPENVSRGTLISRLKHIERLIQADDRRLSAPEASPSICRETRISLPMRRSRRG